MRCSDLMGQSRAVCQAGNTLSHTVPIRTATTRTREEWLGSWWEHKHPRAEARRRGQPRQVPRAPGLLASGGKTGLAANEGLRGVGLRVMFRLSPTVGAEKEGWRRAGIRTHTERCYTGEAGSPAGVAQRLSMDPGTQRSLV